MLQKLFFATAFCLISTGVFSQNSKSFSIIFYNVENLFDTIDNPLTDDDAFTPAGKKQWSSKRYLEKLDKLSKVLTVHDSSGPDFIGLCEVENRQVVVELSQSGSLKNYEIIHRESPDKRGIDVAFLFKKDIFSLIAFSAIPVGLPDRDRPTRDILHIQGLIKGHDEPVHFFVNHWPSRSGGAAETEYKRVAAATTLKKQTDSILLASSNAQIIIMGDFNDHPDNQSISSDLNAIEKPGLASKTALINLMVPLQLDSLGTYSYKGQWNILDQFIVSKSLKNGKGLDVDSTTPIIIKEDWMLYTHPKFKTVSPNRTYGGNNYYGGYSDHLPIRLVLTCKP